MVGGGCRECPGGQGRERGTLRRRCNDDEGNHLCGLGRLSGHPVPELDVRLGPPLEGRMAHSGVNGIEGLWDLGG
jgi:hypothetical protein